MLDLKTNQSSEASKKKYYGLLISSTDHETATVPQPQSFNSSTKPPNNRMHS